MTIPALASTDALVSWVESPRSGHGVHVHVDDAWTMHSYSELAGRVRAAAHQLRGAGMSVDDVVAICDPRPIDFLVAFFGVLYAGGTPLPLPASSTCLPELIVHMAVVLDLVHPRLLITTGGSQDLVDAALARAKADVEPVTLHPHSLAEWSREPLAAVGLLQCTSGSTGAPRGVLVTCDNLIAQVNNVVSWHRMGQDEGLASWLPLHHDMGLVGLLLSAVLSQVDLWQLTPEQFLGAPHRWLECLDRGRATITAAPTFGYGYVARHVTPEQLDSMDFSNVKSMIVGAERLAPATLRSFADLLTPRRLSARALRPAYGLAEATLAVTGTDIGHTQHLVGVDWSTARPGARLPLGPVRTLMGTHAPDPAAIVSCGRPLKRTNVRIVDEDGVPVPEGFLGEITVVGPSVAAGYVGSTEETVTRFDRGQLSTGDAGFLYCGDLYVVGRMADSLKIRGRRIPAESVEQRVATDHSLSVHRCVAIPTIEAEGLALILEEAPESVCDEDVLRSARAVAGPTVNVRVLRVPAGTIERTTSGKVRRRLMWRLLSGAFRDHDPRSDQLRQPVAQES